MARVFKTILFVMAFGTAASAQTVEISPPELTRLPVAGLGSGIYWQQLVVEFAHDDVPSDAALSIEIPSGMVLTDSDEDGLFDDEIRLVYVPAAAENPGFFVAPTTAAQRVEVGSFAAAAAQGRLYLQFPVTVTAVPSQTDVRYGPILFADDREQDIVNGPTAMLVTQDEFATAGSMNVVAWGPALAAADTDTLSSALGTVYPDPEEVLALVLPDLVFDGGISTASNLVGLGDGDDDNDVEYRFFLSNSPTLTAVDSSLARELFTAAGDAYVEREGEGRPTSLLIQDVAPGTYYVYATSSVTGAIPLARSRGLTVRHEPVFQSLGPAENITLDSGGLFDASSAPTGSSTQQTTIPYRFIDHDDEPSVHLFYSPNGELDQDALITGTDGALLLAEATPLTATEGLPAKNDSMVFDILDPELIAAGDYYIYAATTDLTTTALMRSAGQIQVRHAPFLRMDALDDAVLAAADTIVTGGVRPQRYITFTWGRSGFDGDGDIDDDARIDLYLSQIPASATPADESFTVPGGADQVLQGLADGATQLIVGNIPEDPDARADNQYVWDLWALANTNSGVPPADAVHYVYGMIGDGVNRWLDQMNGGRLNDAAAKLVFAHPPAIRALQPVVAVTVGPGRSARAAWEDMDLDDDARIRVVLSREDHGAVSTYAALSGGVAYVVNSADGRAAVEVDTLWDLSEDSAVDYLEVRIDHITRGISTDDPLADGDYFIYMAIADGADFGAALAVRAPGLIQVLGVADEAVAPAPIQLMPEVFSMGTGGQIQNFEVRVNVSDPVDLVQATFVIDAASFAAVDQNPLIDGIQPFVVGPGFQAAKLVTNDALDDGIGTLRLSMGYLEPTAAEIMGLGPDGVLATFRLSSLDVLGPVSIGLEVETAAGRVSRVESDGEAVVELTTGPVSLGELVAGRATVMGAIALEGREDMSAQVDFSLRRWGDYTAVADEVFATANDINPSQAGVQVEIQADGAFQLIEVPVGRWDLHAGLSGYLEAWIPGLEVFPAQTVEGAQPASPGSGDRPRMLGGDVTGYLEVDGIGVQDNEVTLADWDFVAAFFGLEVTPGTDGARADITGDGQVNIQDLSLVGANFRRGGPVPVYKPTVGGKPRVHWAQAGPVTAGEIALHRLVAERLAGLRGYELELAYDPAQWRLVDGDVALAPGLLTTERREGNRLRIAATLVGWAGDLQAAGPVLEWRLEARRDGAQAPEIRSAHFVDGEHRLVAAEISAVTRAVPQVFELAQNHPNPFNPETAIDFTVPADAGMVRLDIFDALGQHIAVLCDGELAPGAHRMHWRGLDQEGRPVASGVYLYRLQSGRRELAKRMVLVR